MRQSARTPAQRTVELPMGGLFPARTPKGAPEPPSEALLKFLALFPGPILQSNIHAQDFMQGSLVLKRGNRSWKTRRRLNLSSTRSPIRRMSQPFRHRGQVPLNLNVTRATGGPEPLVVREMRNDQKSPSQFYPVGRQKSDDRNLSSHSTFGIPGGLGALHERDGSQLGEAHLQSA